MFNFSLVLKGMVIGVANIIPGLSGGTMAVILGVYHQLIAAMSCVIKFKKGSFKTSFWFLFLLVLGAVVGIYSFSYLIEWLLFEWAEPISYFFIGTILSSIPYIVKSESVNYKSLSSVGVFVVFMLIGLFFVGLKTQFLGSSDVSISLFYLFISACVAAGAMIIPGVSGSLVFVLFGTYNTVILAIKMVMLKPLLVIGLGAVCGLMLTSVGINFCLKKFFNLTMMAILGLMLGTMPGLFVGFTGKLVGADMLGLFLGIVVVWSFSLVSKK